MLALEFAFNAIQFESETESLAFAGEWVGLVEGDVPPVFALH